MLEKGFKGMGLEGPDRVLSAPPGRGSVVPLDDIPNIKNIEEMLEDVQAERMRAREAAMNKPASSEPFKFVGSMRNDNH